MSGDAQAREESSTGLTEEGWSLGEAPKTVEFKIHELTPLDLNVVIYFSFLRVSSVKLIYP